MRSEMLPEIEDALDTWQEGLSQFMYGPAERQRLVAILRAKLFAFTRTAPAGMAEIVAAAEAWVEAEKTCDEYCFHSVAQRAYARARFLALVAAHEAEVAKVLEPLVAVAAEPDNEITSWPFWLVIDPRQTFSARVGDVASMIKGIFFSRKDADAHIEAKRHRYGSRVGVFCCSAHDSWQYKALYEASRAAAALRRRVTGG